MHNVFILMGIGSIVFEYETVKFYLIAAISYVTTSERSLVPSGIV